MNINEQIIGGKSLLELTEMGMYELQKFMRENGDPHWGRVDPNTGKPLVAKDYEVTLYYNKIEHCSARHTIKAINEDEAIEEAEDKTRQDEYYCDEIEFTESSAYLKQEENSI